MNRNNSRKLFSGFLVLVFVFQTIAGIFLPVDFSLTPPYVSNQETRAAASTWEGDESTDWGTAGNWSLASVPDSTTDVIIDGTQTNQPTLGVAGATIASLNISGASTLTLGGDLTVSGNAAVNDGATLTYTQGTVADLTVNGTLTVYSGGTITCPYTDLTTFADGVAGGKGRIITAGNIDVQLGGTIHADGLGFGKGAGPGKSTTYFNGGSYGGRSGNYASDGNIGPTYGSLTNPVSLGSGGTITGTAGGGAIIISSTGTVTINGILSANGTGTYGTGSGGTVNIAASILAGSGTIRANGADNTFNSNYPSGGGGRISLNGVTTDNFTGTLQANGGSCYERGYAGTIYLNSTKRTSLILGGVGNLTSLRLGTDDDAADWVFDTITIQSGGILEIEGNPF